MEIKQYFKYNVTNLKRAAVGSEDLPIVVFMKYNEMLLECVIFEK